VFDDKPIVGEMIRTCLAEYPLTVRDSQILPDPSQVPNDAAAIFCDVRVEGQDAIEFVCKLKALGFAAPIIIITADRSRNTVMQAISAGITAFIPKPLTKAYLLTKLERNGLMDRIVGSSPGTPRANPLRAMAGTAQ
jgi:DNA-binding NtrC family response regulator